MKLKSVIIFLSIALVHAGAAFAQTQQAEAQINQYLEGISYWRFQYSEEDTSFGHKVVKEDSVMWYNELLRKHLVNASMSQQLPVNQPLRTISNPDFTATSSADKLMRIYSWETHAATAAHDVASVAAYRKGSNASATTLHFPAPGKKVGGSYEEILTVTGNGGSKYYLAVYKTTVSEKETIKGVVAFDVKDGVSEAAIFEENGKTTSAISYSYDYMSNYDFEKMKEEHTIHLSKNGKKLYVPVVADGRLNGKWKVYNFDGGKFVYDKTE